MELTKIVLMLVALVLEAAALTLESGLAYFGFFGDCLECLLHLPRGRFLLRKRLY